MNPSESAFPGYEFTIAGEQYFIGLFYYNVVEFPDIVFPALLAKEGAIWSQIDSRQPMWIDQQESFTPELMASLIVKDFNETLATRGGGEPMTWNQKLASIFQVGLAVQDNQLVIK